MSKFKVGDKVVFNDSKHKTEGGRYVKKWRAEHGYRTLSEGEFATVKADYVDRCCIQMPWGGSEIWYKKALKLFDAPPWVFSADGSDGLIEKVKSKKSPKGSQAYKGNGKHTFEVVVEHDVNGERGGAARGVYRLRVPGGWLYRSHGGHTMTFVPVPEVVGYKV